MDAFRIHLKGWFSSFRYPIFIAGTQLSVPVPPLSTIYGMISAAKGNFVTPDDVRTGYVFKSNGKAKDLETIYELDSDTPLKASSNVCKREILFEPELYIYLDKSEYAGIFRRPHYPLLMGRSSELAMADEITEVSLTTKKGAKLGGTLVPFPNTGVYGAIQALPTHFSDSIPRKALGTRPFYIVRDFINYDAGELPYDEEKQWGVWWHGRV
jgi:CRISPR-associated protein Cas5t